MIDMEKVKKGLGCCKESTNDDPFRQCSECPYNDISISVQECRAVLSADALALLKEQEAVKPRVSSVEQRCGNCNKVIEMDGWLSCPWCGKRIDWEGWWKKNGTRNQDT